LNLGEKLSKLRAESKVEINPALEQRVAAVENRDETTPFPAVADLVKDNDRAGVLEERSSSLLGHTWTPMFCVIAKDGHFYWIKNEKMDKQPQGRIRFVKPKVKFDINDSVLEITDPDAKKSNTTRYYRVPEDNLKDNVDAWINVLKTQRAKFIEARAEHLLKEDAKKEKTAPVNALSAQAARVQQSEAKKRGARELLVAGAIFWKHQAGTKYERAVWITPGMDRLCWGDPKRATVKGFVMVDDIFEVGTQLLAPTKPNFHGLSISHDHHAYSGTDEDTLQFECDSQQQRDAWIDALKVFVPEKEAD